MSVGLCVCGVRPGGQRSSVVLGQLRRALAGFQVQILKDVDLPFDTYLQAGQQSIKVRFGDAKLQL